MRLLQRLAQFFARAAVMLLVVAVVMPIALVVGLPEPVTLALAIGLPGLTGLFWVARRRHETVAAARRAAAAAVRAVGPKEPSPGRVAPEIMEAEGDTEAQMPRWRRPSLQQARRLDPTRPTAARDPMRFDPAQAPNRAELRMVRYAVVPLLDWPDEVLGERQADLVTGDEVRVLDARGTFLEVECPDGRRGWLHRMTIGPAAEPHPDAQDALDAVLLARGLR